MPINLGSTASGADNAWNKGLAMTHYSEREKRKMRKYIEKMNSLYGYALYALPEEDLGVKRVFGVGSFGLPVVLLSIIPLIFPLWLLVATAETGFPQLVVFGFQITFVPIQIAGIVVHIALLLAGGTICKKFRGRHYGAARGAGVFQFVFWMFL